MTSDNKVAPNHSSVAKYVSLISDTARKSDVIALLGLMEEATNDIPTMWGSSIIGFGKYHYIHSSGREGDTVAVGFSARAKAIAVYGLNTKNNAELIKALGQKQDAKGCIYLSAIDTLDKELLKKLIINAYSLRGY